MRSVYFISAYVTSPSIYEWNSLAEIQYFKVLSKRPDVISIEHSFFLESEKYPLRWLLENISDHWSMIITALPVFMNQASENPWLRLASSCERERSRAMCLMEKISQYVRQLNREFSRKVVKAVHFHLPLYTWA